LNVKTVLFDLDGTLIDSFDLIAQSFTQACQKVLDRNLSHDEVVARWGWPLRFRFEAVDSTRVDALVDAYQACYRTNHDRMIALFPGVREMLEALKMRTIRMGIVTSKRRPTTLLAIERLTLSPYFGAVVTEQDVPVPKPAPDAVFAALRELGAPAETAVMIGDGLFDIQAAQAAGVRSGAALWGTREREALLATGPDFRLTAPADLVTLVDKSPQ
jgi:pyrophosphatase PpaX